MVLKQPHHCRIRPKEKNKVKVIGSFVTHTTFNMDPFLSGSLICVPFVLMFDTHSLNKYFVRDQGDVCKMGMKNNMGNVVWRK